MEILIQNIIQSQDQNDSTLVSFPRKRESTELCHQKHHECRIKSGMTKQKTLFPDQNIQPCQWIDFLCEESEPTMNRDRILFKKMKNEQQNPILRFYKWKPPTLSYGRTQKIDEETRKKFILEGWNLTERPTGGGKVFHKNDLCFSVFWRKENGCLPWTILDSYRLIHEWIQKSLEKIGVESSLLEIKKDDLKQSWCFQNPVSFDLISNHSKVVGGAQWRDGNSALHQGSIQLDLNESTLPIFKSNFESFFNVTFS